MIKETNVQSFATFIKSIADCEIHLFYFENKSQLQLEKNDSNCSIQTVTSSVKSEQNSTFFKKYLHISVKTLMLNLI